MIIMVFVTHVASNIILCRRSNSISAESVQDLSISTPQFSGHILYPFCEALYIELQIRMLVDINTDQIPRRDEVEDIYHCKLPCV